MDDPRLLPPPDDFLGRIRALALDLAYGFTVGDFPSAFDPTGQGRVLWSGAGEVNKVETFNKYMSQKWQGAYPSLKDVLVLGYLILDGSHYIISQKALELLEKPATPPTVFISYKRSESAALGLLTVARLKMAGVPNPFIDMQIDPGDLWHSELEHRIKEAEYFVSLLAPTTLESKYVRKEIQWAIDAQKVIIPIWHNGFAGNDDFFPELGTFNAIRIKEESAAEYDLAMTLLLNRLGYAP